MSGHHDQDPGVVALVGLREEDLDPAQVAAAVERPAAGGVVAFTGVVRDHDGGRAVTRLSYTAHPRAEALLTQVATEAAALNGVLAVAVLHRVGTLEIGEAAVVMAVSAAHRGHAFRACAWLIDELKARVPIWKEQVFADGTSQWVGLP
ncbi:MAG: molybdenum cofactor biosynthesis protein MoaE [Austwickia sp.]|nr:molybdenum cofactor biosynthesis protein MoaE [Austwickia sp.]MBK8435942.1 molybdenum cofactor biosynthesis protein MoaE [Austwickia sp.]MBK9101626.1 molybdenum cofactor biosynthesis protein MoaE [Austwickia sp.]